MANNTAYRQNKIIFNDKTYVLISPGFQTNDIKQFVLIVYIYKLLINLLAFKLMFTVQDF